MKITLILVPLAVVAFASCDRSDSSKVKDKVDDALDRRPNEELRDTGEDVRDAAKDAGRDIKDAAKDVKEDVKDAVR